MKRFSLCFLLLLLLAGCTAPTPPLSETAPESSPHPPSYDSVAIALLDTGISSRAIDPARILQGYNYVTESTDTEDRINHGTAAAGIIVGCEAAGIRGIAPEALLIPLVITDRVEGKVCGVTPEVLARAVYDAVSVYGADLINLSLGIRRDSLALREAVDFAQKRGVLVLSAVGNDGKDGAPYYPAAYDSVVGVGSHDREGKVSSFSQQNGTADFLAPGEDIWLASRNGGVLGAKGTSYATAYATATAARLLDLSPSLSPAELRRELIALTVDVSTAGWDAQSGYGILRWENAP